MIKISIITVSFNSEKYIEETIQSVVNQTYSNIEYIIIDGLSTDNTVSIVKKYRKGISYFVSEKDKSMYDAINKGINASTGDFIYIMNSDDFFYDNNVVTDVVKYINENIIKYAVYGIRSDVDKNSAFIRQKKSFHVSFKELLLSRNMTFIAHSSLFVSKSFIKKVGLYNTSILYASDFDFVLRGLKQFKFSYFKRKISCFRVHEESITASGKIGLEKNKVLINNGINKYSKLYQKLYFIFIWSKYIFYNPEIILIRLRRVIINS